MLRECHRVLKPGSRSAGYVIHTPSGLTQAGERRAAELGPPNVTAPLSPDALARQAGLSVVVLQDVTEDFRATCEALLRTREALAAELRAEEGDDVYEDERTKQTAMLTGIDEGVLCRSLIVATRH